MSEISVDNFEEVFNAALTNYLAQGVILETEKVREFVTALDGLWSIKPGDQKLQIATKTLLNTVSKTTNDVPGRLSVDQKLADQLESVGAKLVKTLESDGLQEDAKHFQKVYEKIINKPAPQ